MIRVLDKKRNPAGWPVEIKQIQLTIQRRYCILLPNHHPHPARGREPSRSSFSAFLFSNVMDSHIYTNPHPARGRELMVYAHNVDAIAKHSPTPQGDGNLISRYRYQYCRKQLTPRKGTRTGCSCLPCRSRFETTYTPQGDGNSPEAAALPLSPETLTYPARGRPFGKEGSS